MLRTALILLAAATLSCSGGCSSIGRPAPTDLEVTVDDVAGAWRYHTTQGEVVEITLREDGTFEQRLPSEPSPREGTWSIDGAYLEMSGFGFSDPVSIEQTQGRARFYLTSWYTEDVAPFGGDSLDPDIWEVWWRP